MAPFLDVAVAAAKAAAEDIMCYYRGDFEVEIKPDQTPVTVADRRAENIIRQILLDAFPDHGFFGEEGGKEHADAEYLWLVDPIDGTKSFVGGYGMFSTQIALMHGGEWTPADDAQAVQILEATVDRLPGTTSAQVALAQHLLDGRGAPADRQRARALLEAAAAKGDSDAPRLLEQLDQQ